MKVLIIGGGIAGCSCAALLQKYKLAEVTLIEQAPEFKNIGYVMGLWSTGRTVLEELGLSDQIRELSHEYDADVILDRHGKLIKQIDFADFPVLQSTIAIKRADLHRTLYEQLDSSMVRFNTTCTHLEQQGAGVEVTLSDGTTDTYDLVIGADGIDSTTREYLFGAKHVHSYGWRIWMWWLPEGYASSDRLTTYYGNGKLCATLPFRDQPVAIAIAPSTHSNAVPEVQTLFSDFAPAVQNIMATAPAQNEMYCDEVRHVTLTEWHKGRVVLVGDAQHATSPITGMGASMALEDISVLVEELRMAETIDMALSSYAERRSKRIRRFHRMIKQMDRWAMADGVTGMIRNKVLAYIPTSYFVRIVERFVED